MPERIGTRVREAIAKKVFPGCVIGIVRKDRERDIFPFGNFTYEAGSEKVSEDTVYDIASITKSIPTASLALTLVAEGKLSLAEPVSPYVPELQNDYGATIEDLLRYRVHGTRMSELRHKTFEEIRTHVFEQGFMEPPGKSVYTNLPAYLLGIIIERTGDTSLASLAHQRFFESLGMQSTTFFPTPSDCAPTEIDERGEVRGLPHDESAYVFAKERKATGHAGLFSTAPDILDFLESLLQGTYRSVVEGAEKGLGWQVNDERFMGKHAIRTTFGKTGFTGTSVVCDVERGIGFAILSNRTYPKRPLDDSTIFEFRADIADIVFSSS